MSLFLGNMWDELLSERGLRLLEANYGRVRGNWLREPRHAARPDSADVVVHAPSTLDGGLRLADIQQTASQLIGWVLFPDQVLGWDFGAHDYLYRVHPELTAALAASVRMLVNSAFSGALLRMSGVNNSLGVVPLAVDCQGIADCADARRGSRGIDCLHVLWAHMWRTQKDPERALRVVDTVLERCPQVRVSIGRAWSWADPQHSPPAFRRNVTAQLAAMRSRHRERVAVVPWFYEPTAYWQFLGTVDVSFTCAREESFGVAMMEHAAAGIACVAPRMHAYPELHTGALLTDPTEEAIAGAVCSLVNDPVRRQSVAASCRGHAQRFAAQAVVAALSTEIDAAIRARPR